MTNPLDGNGVAAAEMAFTGDPRPGLPPGMRSSLEAAIVAYLVTASSSEERKRRAAGPSSVKRPMPDPLAKHRAPAPSHTAVEPVADALRAFRLTGSLELGVAIDNALSTLTAQAAALVAAERERDELQAQVNGLSAKCASLAPHGECACSYDTPDDLCLHHSPKLTAAESEVATLKARVAELEADRDQAQRNRDMWKAQCERQAAQATTNTDFLDFVVRRTWDNPLSAEEALSAIQWHPTLKAFYERSRIDPRRLTHQEKNNG